MAVGAVGDSDGGHSHGAVWLLFLQPPTFDLVVGGPNTDCSADPVIDCETLTAGLDPQLGEFEQPPLPPTDDIFDARFIVSGIEGLVLDLRNSGATNPEWQIAVQAGLGGYPVTLT